MRIDADLKFHHIATGGSADKSSSYVRVRFRHGPNITGGGVVVEEWREESMSAKGKTIGEKSALSFS